MRSIGQTASHNRYDRQRKSMQSCTSAWHCHDGAHGQRPQTKQARRSKVWPDSRQHARMRLPGVLRASRPWKNGHTSQCTTSLCQRPCDTKGVHGGTLSPREWRQGCKARDTTRQYMSTCSQLVWPVALASEMEGWACARGDMQAHGRFCIGATSFCPKVIHNWRALWYSMPSTNRRELLLK